ncbi:Kef-type K+ transport system, membrane component KefB [Lachnospiraceae bacterium A10]|jgi:Kef-type K+ transport system membrane component KefB|nr:Kef-type K+ transport system, membrane component KefB [Lachnospiraceae bacterium A10]
MDYTIFLWLALIIVSTKLLGIFAKKVDLPEVVGFLIAGIILGPSALNIITITGANGDFLTDASELGVIFLMFSAGLTTEMEEMKKNMLASFVVAVIGVCVPLLFGTVAYALFFKADLNDYTVFLEALFVGVVLTATSVSITVQTLKELGHLNGAVGTTILGAAVIDDILGIVVLTIVSSMKDTSVSPAKVGIQIVLYAVMIAVVFLIVHKLEFKIADADHKRRAGLFAIAFALLMAYVSEVYFGIADITGAYFAGLMLCMSKIRDYVDVKVSDISNMFFSCVFFACIGIKVTLGGMTREAWFFAVILTIVAVLTKVVGCGLGAKICGFKNKEALQIGVGMISRGEVALIVADKGASYGLVSKAMFPPVVLMVIVTTLITPLLLKLVFKGQKAPEAA